MYILLLLALPNIDIQLSGPNRTIREGDSVSISCIINEGLPKPEIHWSKDKWPLEEQKNTTLRLTKVTAKDAGRYTCKAKNEGGSAETSINVTVDSE